jgi:predicted phage terminase large subunit-like protein
MSEIDSLLRTDALTFLNRAHIELRGSPLDADLYLRLLAFDIERIGSGELRKFVINMPPGSGKTFIFAVGLSLWLLGHNPSSRILIVSYAEVPALLVSKHIRDILQAAWFRKAFPGTLLAKNQRAAGDFATTAGGAVYARSIDGATTGLRCDVLICDDLVQIRDSGNLPHLDAINKRYDAELVSRLNPPGTIVIVQHRLNKHDLTGYLHNRSGYKLRALPLIATHECEYRLKSGVWRCGDGDVLRPTAYSPEYIAELREHTGAPGFGPLYQQSFDGPDVIQVQREAFVVQRFYARPAVPYFLSIDPNYKGESGQSFSVLQCWGLLGDGRYLLYDQWRGRASQSAFARQIRRMKANYRPCAILIEDNGPALELQEQFATPSCPVHLLTASGDKVARLRRNIDLFRDRKIVLRAGALFNEEFMAEHEAFPYGPNDDQVDAATQFFDWIRSNTVTPITHPRQEIGARSSIRQARETLYWNAGRPTRYVFYRRR